MITHWLEKEDAVINPPEHHQRRVRPQTKRIPSSGETKKRIKCGSCKQLGHHNKKSFRNPAA